MTTAIASTSTAVDLHAIRGAYARRYVAHFDADFTSATALNSKWLVTHAHGAHSSWSQGKSVEVWVSDLATDRPRKESACVEYVSPMPPRGTDYALLKMAASSPPLQEPVVDASIGMGSEYVLVAASARTQSEPSSVRHGCILSTLLDANGHVKGDGRPEEGDSGGGVFLVSSGALVAICLAADGPNAALLPVTVPMAKVLELERAGVP